MTEITCETQGHLWGADGRCVMCKTPKPIEQRTSKKLLPHQRRIIEREIEAALHPRGMQVGLAKVSLPLDLVQRMVAIIDSMPADETPPSRSVQRRVAAQRGEPAPTFETPDIRELNRQMCKTEGHVFSRIATHRCFRCGTEVLPGAYLEHVAAEKASEAPAPSSGCLGCGPHYDTTSCDCSCHHP